MELYRGKYRAHRAIRRPPIHDRAVRTTAPSSRRTRVSDRRGPPAAQVSGSIHRCLASRPSQLLQRSVDLLGEALISVERWIFSTELRIRFVEIEVKGEIMQNLPLLDRRSGDWRGHLEDAALKCVNRD